MQMYLVDKCPISSPDPSNLFALNQAICVKYLFPFFYKIIKEKQLCQKMTFLTL
jgi:hypothetical protein